MLTFCYLGFYCICKIYHFILYIALHDHLRIFDQNAFYPITFFWRKKFGIAFSFSQNHVFGHQKPKEAPNTNVFDQTPQAIGFSLKESLRELWGCKLGAKGPWLYSYWVIGLYHLLGYIDYIGYMTYG